MDLGKLVRAFAWEVAPQQTGPLTGGALQASKALIDGLNQTATRGQLDQGMPVGFVQARTNSVRDELLGVAYGTAAEALAASQQIAARLVRATDHRTKPCLLVVTVHETARASERRTLVSTFPQDQVMRRSGTGVQVLDDVFSLTSRLRKAALVSGANDRTGYLKARVVDYETTKADKSAADFWVVRFLNAAPEVNTREGTKLLGQALKATYKKVKDDQAAFDQLAAVIGLLRTGPRARRSLETVATNFLDGVAQDAFRSVIGNGPETRAAFNVDVSQLDEQLQFWVFQLRNGVKVSAPFVSVGTDDDADVQLIEDADGRRLTASGIVESESRRSNA